MPHSTRPRPRRSRSLRLTDADLRRLDALSDKLEATPQSVARAALLAGLRLLESDDSLASSASSLTLSDVVDAAVQGISAVGRVREMLSGLSTTPRAPASSVQRFADGVVVRRRG